MLFLLSGGFGFKEMARQFPDSAWWRFLAFQTDHVAWVGGGAWDLIQPSFMFMVGVAMPFSYASRRARGDSFAVQFRHVLWRSFVLLTLAVLFASKGGSHTTYVFFNVLAQIALGYPLLFLLSTLRARVQWAAVALLLGAAWAAYFLHPLPAADFDYLTRGVKPFEKSEVLLPGFFAHWNKGTNFGADLDRWFLNLFPTGGKPFLFNAGGYVTFSFVASLATMTLGLLAGSRLRANDSPLRRLRWLLVTGGACLAAGLLAGATVCPIVKRIWTPSWTLYSGGIVLLILAAFYAVCDVRGWKRWAFPLVVVGMNSIAAYLMEMLTLEWFSGQWRIHFGSLLFSGPCGVIWLHLASLLTAWLLLFWMYRRQIFLRL